MPRGYWCPVLHAHLPFVRHPEYPDFLEEDWFFEALTETYIPLVLVLDGLERDGVDYRLTMTLSPSLLAMMSDRLLIERFHRYLDRLVRLSEKELTRTRRLDARFARQARVYNHEFTRIRQVFRATYGSDIVGAFRKHRDAGKLEIITCGATHGFLPLMDSVPEAVRAQVLVGADYHLQRLGRAPGGIWLPECGYLPGHERYLREAGLYFSFLEAHGLTDAEPRPSYGVLAPILSPGGIVFFGRDIESSRQVWSAEVGYPGDVDYREFYKDIGWELPLAYLGEIIPDGIRKNVGIKYYRVTGKVDLADKKPYERARALQKAGQHAEHFLRKRLEQICAPTGQLDRPPIVVSPYDAELFGHWWCEGPDFLDALFRRIAEQNELRCITPPEYLEAHPECEVAQPPQCTWGAKGYAEVWLNPRNDWIYRHLEIAAERMVELARRFDAPTPDERRALDQAARELLLAQSSDWAFILKTGTTVDYATKRTRDHVARFTYLYGALCDGRLEVPILREFEQRDTIFPNIDYKVYAGGKPRRENVRE